MSDELRDRASALAVALRDHGREIEKARKALDVLAGEAGWHDRAQRTRSVKALQALATSAAPDVAGFLPALEEAVATFVRERRHGFVDQLVSAVQKAELPWRELGQQPPVFDVGGIQATVDFDKEEVALAYGREPLVKVGLDAAELLEARREQIARLQGTWPGAGDFFAACDAAYRARCGREGKPPGERVHIVDLIPELLVEYEQRGVRHGGFGRVELAYCLDRLAREGALEQSGRRLELGTATGGSTKDKKRVLFLAAGMGGGQYYLSVRVVAAPGGSS